MPTYTTTVNSQFPMHLLAESGGTKTQWYLYDRDGLRAAHRTAGMNPNVASVQDLEQQQRIDWGDALPDGQGLNVHFYGAGLGAQAAEQSLHGVLERLFPGACLRLESDMLAAARAASGDQPGIICILGTGSNCCYWDGNAIIGNLGSHGYLFNDEGSGADLGRTILSALLSGEVGHDIEHLFRDWSGGKQLLDIRSEIYQAPKVNVALAEYSRFLAAHLDNPGLHYMVIGRFMAFFTRTVLRIPAHKTTPIHFVGSVAEVYQVQLREAMGLLQLAPASILAAPGEALLSYHIGLLHKPTE